MAAVVVSLVVRYRAGDRLMRQQIKWLALAAAVFAACLLIALLGVAAGQVWLTGAAFTVSAVVSLFGIPAAMTVAILRHRLFARISNRLFNLRCSFTPISIPSPFIWGRSPCAGTA